MRIWLSLLPIVALYACRGENTPSSSTAVSEATRGLPQRLVPADFGTPTYKPPRNLCAPALRDQARPSVQLTLVSWTTRIDWTRSTDGVSTTTVTARVPEGEYRLSPDTAYGLQPGQRLRVDCGSQTAVTVLEPAG
jgi:hypothetical protein